MYKDGAPHIFVWCLKVDSTYTRNVGRLFVCWHLSVDLRKRKSFDSVVLEVVQCLMVIRVSIRLR